MKRKSSKVRVIYPQRKLVKPKPDCPGCGKGFLRGIAYQESMDTYGDIHVQYNIPYCNLCGWMPD